MRNVVNIRKTKDYDLYIGRENKTYGLKQSKWFNPEPLKSEEDRNNNLIRYESYIRNTPELYNSLEELDGLVLACWCAEKRCHGHVLLELLNEKKLNDLFNSPQ